MNRVSETCRIPLGYQKMHNGKMREKRTEYMNKGPKFPNLIKKKKN